MGVLIFCLLHTVYIPLEDPNTAIIDELWVRGVYLVKYPNIRNYFIKTKPQLEGVENWLSQRVNTPILKVNIVKRGSTSGDSLNTMKTGLFISYEKEPVDIIIEPIVKVGGSTSGRENNIWPSEKFKGSFAADYERAFIRLSNGQTQGSAPTFGQTQGSAPTLEFILGRERFAFGPSARYNLLLSGSSPPMDGLFASYTTEKFKFSFLASRLDNIIDKDFVCESDLLYGDTINANRFLSIRRLDWCPNEKINIGLSEAVIYGGENELPDFYHLNPIAVSYAYEFTREEIDHNILWYIDFRLNLHNLALYGEFLMDDFQYEKDLQKEPNHTGFLIGLSGVKNKMFFNLEYTRVSRWAYNHFHPWQRYTYLGKPIGHPYGCDFDDIFSKLIYHLNPKIDLFTNCSYGRKGAGAITSLWPIHELPRVTGETFPADNFLLSPITSYFNFNVGLTVICRDMARYVPTLPMMQGVISAEAGIYKISEKTYPVFKTSLILEMGK